MDSFFYFINQPVYMLLTIIIGNITIWYFVIRTLLRLLKSIARELKIELKAGGVIKEETNVQ